MGKNKSPSLPTPPSFQADPTASAAIPSLYNFGMNAANFNFGPGGLSALLEQAIQLDPEVTHLALQNARGYLQPQFNDIVQQIRNEAAANNQLESSTFTDALSKNAFNLESQYQGIAAGAALEDRQRALQNRLGLFGTGLNAIQGAGSLGLQNQGQQNQFNLSNYENQVAAALAGQKEQTGGFLGALTGALGGGAAGLGLGIALAPFTGGLSLLPAGIGALGGGLAGGFGPSGTGGQFLGAGAGSFGSLLGGGGGLSNFSQLQSSGLQTGLTFPGQYASNNPWSISGSLGPQGNAFGH